MTRYSDRRYEALRRFFADNPDEELTMKDIELKFDCTRAQARLMSNKAIDAGICVKRCLMLCGREVVTS